MGVHSLRTEDPNSDVLKLAYIICLQVAVWSAGGEGNFHGFVINEDIACIY